MGIVWDEYPKENGKTEHQKSIVMIEMGRQEEWVNSFNGI